MIKIENICKAYQSHQVLDHLALTIEQGQVVSVIGASGAGKPTLLRTLNALEKAEKGEIHLTNFSVDFQKAKKRKLSHCENIPRWCSSNFISSNKKRYWKM